MNDKTASHVPSDSGERDASVPDDTKRLDWRILEVPGGFYLTCNNEKILRSIHDNLLPQFNRILELVNSVPKGSQQVLGETKEAMCPKCLHTGPFVDETCTFCGTFIGKPDAPLDHVEAVLQKARCPYRYCGSDQIRLLYHCTSCDKFWPVPGGGLNRRAAPSVPEGSSSPATSVSSKESSSVSDFSQTSPASEQTFSHNPEHEIGTCTHCGGEMIYNVPRLGKNGGFIHKANRSFQCLPMPASPSVPAGGEDPS